MLKFKLKSLAVVLCTLIACGAFTARAQLLWKIEKPGSDKVSYLLGTHHFVPVNILDSIAGLDQALNSVEKLYGEVDMALMNNPSEMMKFAGMMAAPADSALNKILTPAELDSVNTVWSKLSNGMAPLEMMYGLKPSVISTQIMSLVMMQRFPDKDFSAPGIDQLMQNKAKEQGKQVAGLEDVEFQLDMLYGAPISKQKKALMEAVRDDGEKQIQQLQRITDAYMARDLDAVEAIMTEPDVMSEEDAEKMITSRNVAWAKVLAPEMTERPLMVVVGAGHLPGEKGLIQLLRNAGYTATPIY